MEVRLILRELRDAGPGPLARRAHESEDLLQLIVIRGAGEERSACVHLCHDAAGRPDVDRGVVGAGAEQDVWSAVPQCDNFITEGVYWDAEGASEAEICEFELSTCIDQEVLGLEIAVQDAVLVAEVDPTEELLHKGFDGGGVELAAVAARVHVFLQIFVHVFKDQHELVFRVDDIVEGDNVFVLQFLHKADFTDRGTRRSFFTVEVDFFKSNEFAGLSIATFEDLPED